jgi:DnaK suppressor protein
VNEIKTYEHYHREEGDIEAALRRLHDGYYGYCIETGEKIGVERLLAAPQASLCVEAQERKEKNNRNNSAQTA